MLLVPSSPNDWFRAFLPYGLSKFREFLARPGGTPLMLEHRH